MVGGNHQVRLQFNNNGKDRPLDMVTAVLPCFMLYGFCAFLMVSTHPFFLHNLLCNLTCWYRVHEIWLDGWRGSGCKLLLQRFQSCSILCEIWRVCSRNFYVLQHLPWWWVRKLWFMRELTSNGFINWWWSHLPHTSGCTINSLKSLMICRGRCCSS